MSSQAIIARKLSGAAGEVVGGSPVARFFALIEGREYEIILDQAEITHSPARRCQLKITGTVSLEAAAAIMKFGSN